jgi:hypothetical protein
MNQTILVVGDVNDGNHEALRRRLLRSGHTPHVERHGPKELMQDADVANQQSVPCRFDVMIVDASVWEEWTGHRNFYVHFRQLFEQNPGCTFMVANGKHCSQLPAFIRNQFLDMTAG